jgi:uncharacterized protein (TIGR03437 family)
MVGESIIARFACMDPGVHINGNVRLALLFLAAAALPAGEYSTYIGDENTWHIARVIADASGNTYVAGGRTFNLSFDPLRPNALTEAIVAKLDTTGKTVLFAGIGGKGSESAHDVAVDRAGNIYIAGATTSPNFPVVNALYPVGPFRQELLGSQVGFITKYNPTATDVIYSTYFPNPIDGLAVDSTGAVYVTGTTLWSGFPTTPGLPAGPVHVGIPITSGAFLTKISAAGDRIVYSTIISGQAKNCGAGSSCFTSSRGASSVGVALDAAGNAYIAGNSDVSDLPATAGAFLTNGVGAFVAKVNAAGTALSYLTYIGSGGQVLTPFFTPGSRIRALAVDGTGDAYVAGSTFDPHLPVTAGAYQTTFHGWTEIQNFAALPPNDAFALKLNPSGSAVVWGSYLGGNAEDAATAATLDAAGNLWVSGTTTSPEFPNADGWSTGPDFVVEFNATGGLSYSARYPGGTTSQTLSIDAAGLLHVATESGVVSVVTAGPRPAIRPFLVGTMGGQIAAGEVISLYGPHIGDAGAQVTINGIAAPLLYAGGDQINAVVPFGMAGQTSAQVKVGTGAEFRAVVLPAIPQIFAPAVNQDGTLNSFDHPAPVGSVMTIWVTGANTPFPAVPDGQVAQGAQPYLVGQLYADSAPVQILYAGAAPGLIAGVAQINFVAPDSSSVVLTTGKYASAPFPIYVSR